MKTPVITQEILKLISELDEFKGTWRALKTLAQERLAALRKMATIESIGSSTRIEGAKLSDKQVEELLSLVGKQSFSTRDEQEVAGYAYWNLQHKEGELRPRISLKPRKKKGVRLRID